MEEEIKIKKISNIAQDLIMRTLAKSIVYNGARSYPDLLKAISFLIKQVGDENAKKILGEQEYRKTMEMFIKLKPKASNVDVYLNGIDLKKLNNEDLTSPMFLKYQDAVIDLDLYNECIGTLLLLIDHTNLRNSPISTTHITQLLQDKRRIDKEMYYDEKDTEGEDLNV